MAKCFTTIFDESPLNIFDPFDVFSSFLLITDPSLRFWQEHDRLMKTISETDKGYRLAMLLPGFKKEENLR